MEDDKYTFYTKDMEDIKMVEVYLMFNGNCKEAMAFYKEALDGKDEAVLTYKDILSKDDKDYESMKDLIMHGEMNIKGSVISFCDYHNLTVGDHISVVLKLDSEDEVVTCFNNLKVGAEVLSEVAPSFFSPMYGNLKDKFGVNWIILARKKDA